MGKRKAKGEVQLEKATSSKKNRSAVLKDIGFNESYLDLAKWSRHMQEGLENGKPFPHWQLDNFLDNSHQIVEDIEIELQNFSDWHRKENDLYSLYQTDDFKSLDTDKYPSLHAFRQFLYGSVKDWLIKVTGVELLDQVDMNGSCYSHTDGLLPHNDLIDTRRFAFVYYLTPFVWEKDNGGQLNLYNCDTNEQPTTVAAQLVPRRNSLVLFEVSHKSWHKVAEILSAEDPRLSINGWFHSSRRLEAKCAPILQQPRINQSSSKGKLTAFINKTYLETEKQQQIQEVFGENSEISLKEFLKENIISSLINELKIGKFEDIGPPNKRYLRTASLEELGETSLKLATFLKSSTTTDFLGRITGYCPASLTVRRVEHGSYTVLGDEDADEATKDGFSLETHIYLSENEWPEKAGGHTIYIGKDEEEPVIQIHPEHNTLAIVLREPEVLSFLKYTNSLADGYFFQICLNYYSVQVDHSDKESDGDV